MKTSEVIESEGYEPGSDTDHPSGKSYWIYLRDGYVMPDGCHAIHEDTKTMARKRLKEVLPE